jgi:hypothetical protein
MTDAAGLDLAAPTRFRLDRSAVIDGRRYVRWRTSPGRLVDPGTATALKPIACTAGSPPAGTSARTVRSVAAASGEIALTFDMGGRRRRPAHRPVPRARARVRHDLPDRRGGPTEIGALVLEEVRDHPELFELGNHTVHHCNLRDGDGGSACPATRPTAAFVTAELRDADATIASIAGRTTGPYWRPPYGATDAALAAVAADASYPYTMLWSTDTIDWRRVSDGGPTAAGIAAKVIANRTAGAIVLMHLGGYETRDALPAMIHGLRGAGYTPTSLSALFRAGP